jgi:hypothetical protein
MAVLVAGLLGLLYSEVSRGLFTLVTASAMAAR